MMNNFMELAKNQAINGVNNNEGGPFGAVITDREGNIIAVSNNKVLQNNDPTAHTEISCIREACAKLGTYDLKDYILYTTCEPCPMCLSAIIWSNIKKVYYGCTKNDAAEIGFRDDMIYDYLRHGKADVLDLRQIDRQECIELFDKYKNENRTIY